MVQYEKIVQKSDFENFLGILLLVQGVQGTIWEGLEPIPVMKKNQDLQKLGKRTNCKKRREKKYKSVKTLILKSHEKTDVAIKFYMKN